MFQYGYLLLLILYATVPPLSLFYTLKLIYHDKDKYGVHLQWAAKYLNTLLFLPLLYFKDLDLGLTPRNLWSVFFLVSVFVLTVLGINRARKFGNVFFYFGGVTASFMEEILYRGVLFGLSMSLWNNQWIALAVTSFLFGVWHLKNYYWSGKKSIIIIIQFFYTAFRDNCKNVVVKTLI